MPLSNIIYPTKIYTIDNDNNIVTGIYDGTYTGELHLRTTSTTSGTVLKQGITAIAEFDIPANAPYVESMQPTIMYDVASIKSDDGNSYSSSNILYAIGSFFLKNIPNLTVGSYIDYNQLEKISSWQAHLRVFSNDLSRQQYGTGRQIINNGKIYAWIYGSTIQNVVHRFAGIYFKGLTVQFDYQQLTSLPISITPGDSFIDFTKDNLFSYNIDTSSLFGTPVVTSTELSYKLSSSSTYTKVNGDSIGVTLPKNTFSGLKEYNANIAITTITGLTSTSSDSTYTTTDSIPSTNILYPSNDYVEENVDFGWEYNIGTGTSQYAYDIQFSQDLVNWNTIKSHIVSSETNTSITIDTSGSYYWRIRGYNINDVAGAWSEPALFINRIPPKAPVITSVTQTSRLNVEWQSYDQYSYTLTLTNSNNEEIYNSGIVVSSNKSTLINEYLENGTYTVNLKTSNIYGMESQISTYTINLNVDKSGYQAPNFTISQVDNDVVFNIVDNTQYSYYYLQRDNVTIAKITTNEYIDKFAYGNHLYTLIGISSNDVAVYSSQFFKYEIKETLLVDMLGNTYDIHYRRGAPIDVQRDINIDFESNNFIGANLPDVSYTNFRDINYSVNFYYPDDVKNLLGKVLFYRDIYGNHDFVVAYQASILERRVGNDVNLQLKTTLYSEEIEYDL